MTVADLSRVRQWRNHWDIRRYMYTQHVISLPEHLRWFEECKQDPNRYLLVYEKDEVALGFINIHVLSSGGIANWGFYAAPDAPKGTGRRLGLAAVDYSFAQLSLHKICGQALSYNQPSIRFHQKLGFKQEGIFRHQHFDNNTYHDVVCFGLLAEEWCPQI